MAKAINVVTSYPAPPAGVNLPNEQHIREKYGSKSVLVSNVEQVVDVKVRHDQGFIEQHLVRGVLGRLGPAEATRVAARLAATPEALAEEYRKLPPPGR